jgi:hypothetical protein
MIHNPIDRPNTSQFKVFDDETEFAASHNATLIVIQPDKPIRLCMYGSEDLTKWSGDICDGDDTSKSCKWFKPRITAEEAKKEFLDKLSDDKYVYDSYLDIATLQWVLEDRVHKHRLSLWERFLIWIGIIGLKDELEPEQITNLPEDIWEDDDVNTKDNGS